MINCLGVDGECVYGSVRSLASVEGVMRVPAMGSCCIQFNF